ncbi:MAG: hydratase [Alphaproteobacteria bacterium]|nr:hydratase [Alphaproteobacteria bacterium]
MLTTQQVEAASELLWTHWQEGRRLAALPAQLSPATRTEGYAIQAELEKRSQAPLFGWKIAATSVAGQKHINVDGPLGGRILAERVRDAAMPLPFGGNAMRVAEAEFAFRFARDLAPRAKPYAVSEVLDAVESLHPAVEVPDSRFEDFVAVGAAQLIADNACAHDFVLGPATTAPWRTMDLVEHPVKGIVTGKLERDGKGANVLGDPRVALTWIANELSGLGIPLKQGQIVTTGTCVIPLPIVPGDEVVCEFGPIGRIAIRFAAK